MLKNLKTKEFLLKVAFKIMKSTEVKKGYLSYGNRLVFSCDFDRTEASEFLQSFIINEENVLRYLSRKYKPTWNDKAIHFLNQSCIQKAFVKPDNSIMIFIRNSEIHKILTDTIYVLDLLKEKQIEHTMKIKYVIEQVKIAQQDLLLYNMILKENAMLVPANTIRIERAILKEYDCLEVIARIKKRSIKRKYLRYYVKKGWITWKNLRQVINITDFSPDNIKLVCDKIREESKEKGVDFR